jgi:hypothetical protein
MELPDIVKDFSTVDLKGNAGVSHRPITEGTGESSSRNYVFFLFFLFL